VGGGRKSITLLGGSPSRPSGRICTIIKKMKINDGEVDIQNGDRSTFKFNSHMFYIMKYKEQATPGRTAQ
jgi:hypothetical protein